MRVSEWNSEDDVGAFLPDSSFPSIRAGIDISRFLEKKSSANSADKVGETSGIYLFLNPPHVRATGDSTY